ncbi:glycosyltransferase family 2 protein [Methanococcus maripaludis]|uniref:Glycosyl transferase, family 2 n=1 Tax=Methanococcus maripaludis (strain DSM 14266 / JCM 13030 / NBRC 101832 / S2 / LL) TaxID=267377 RepID=Q6M0B2_METMP|nr:glycosyltransferase family 2 protein [Methanococcus maripaludis]CAF29915.1 Glycosyl transferase, family 2 [Methanococcus maripaludis S2]
MKTLIIIPAYNEELTIGSMILLAKEYGDVLVIDDCSTDKTFEIAEKSAKVIKHTINKGKGHALKTGFEYALNSNYDIVVCIDADGQHDPKEIPKLCSPLKNKEADLVIGSRYLNKTHRKIPAYRKLGLYILNKSTNLVSKSNISDSQSGFRAYSKKCLLNSDLNFSSGYGVESELLHELSKKKLHIKEVDINVRYDVPHKHKKNPVLHGLGVLYNIFLMFGKKAY